MKYVGVDDGVVDLDFSDGRVVVSDILDNYERILNGYLNPVARNYSGGNVFYQPQFLINKKNGHIYSVGLFEKGVEFKVNKKNNAGSLVVFNDGDVIFVVDEVDSNIPENQRLGNYIKNGSVPVNRNIKEKIIKKLGKLDDFSNLYGSYGSSMFSRKRDSRIVELEKYKVEAKILRAVDTLKNVISRISDKDGNKGQKK